MKTLFMAGFSRPSFVPMLGQEIVTSYDQGPSEGVPNLYTSVEQGPAAQPVPNIVTAPPTAPSSKAPDWSKVLADMIKSGSTVYQGITKDQIAQAAAKQRAGLPTGLPNVPPPSGGISSTALAVGGVAAAALIAVIATR